MPRIEDIYLFSRIAMLGSISMAARELAIPASVASDRLKRLEGDLGCTLAHRTTRQLSLTAEGRVFLGHATGLLELYETTLDSVGARASSPTGILRVTAPALFGRLYVSSEIASFLEAFPGVRVNLSLTDKVIDYAAEGIDVALRVGDLSASSWRARRITECPRILCVSPTYVRAHGAPRTPDDLIRHRCIVLGPANDWHLRGENRDVRVRVSGPLSSDNGDVVCDAAVAGVGIALRGLWDVAPYLADGRLIRVLPAYESAAHAKLWVIYPPGRYVSTIARAFVDHIDRHVRSAIADLADLDLDAA